MCCCEYVLFVHCEVAHSDATRIVMDTNQSNVRSHTVMQRGLQWTQITATPPPPPDKRRGGQPPPPSTPSPNPSHKLRIKRD